MTPNYSRALHLLRHYINCIEVRTDLSNGSWWKLTPGIYADLCDENPPYVVVEVNFINITNPYTFALAKRHLNSGVDIFGITELLKQTEQ